MTTQSIKYRIRTLYATAAALATANPVLLEGEPAYEKDTGVEKIGDGVTPYNSLPPKATAGATNLSVTGVTDTAVVVASDTGTDATLPVATATDAGIMSAAQAAKLAGIAAGAEVNVNADWNAVSGDAQILNKPTLGTAAATASTDYAAASHVGAGGTAHANAVASGAAGFMTGADKAKLDGVASGATANTGTVTSVGLAAPTGFDVSGSPVTASGNLTFSFTTGYSLPTTAKQTQWDTAFTQTRQWDGGATGLVAATGRTSLGLGSLATQSGTFSGTSSGVNTGDQTITLTGDVTGSGTGSFAATIASGAVTLANQANVATSSVFYRKTAGSGAPEVQTLATLKTDLGLTGTNSGDQTISLTGEVTGSGTGSFSTTVANSAVIGKVLTGYVSGAGTVAATDTILQAIQKLNGNDAAFLTTSSASSTYLTQANAATTYQPLDSDLTSIAALTTTTFGRSLLTQADAAGTRTTLGLGTLATQSGTFSGTSSGTNTGDQFGSTTASVLLGRGAGAGAGAAQEITLGSGLSMTGTTISVSAGGGNVSVSGTPSAGQAAEWVTGSTIQGVATTGTGSYVKATAPTITLGNATGLPISTGVSGLGTGIATALAINTGTAGAPVLFNGAGGTPSSITLTNGTGLPAAGVTGAYTAAGLTLATSRLLGRTTAATGGAEEISVGANLSLSGGSLSVTGLGSLATLSALGNITSAGAIGSTANLPLITTTAGVVTVGSFGTGANTFCQGNDSRLSDARTPTAHTHGNITNVGAIGSTSGLPIITTTSGVLTTGAFGTTAGTFAEGNDSRITGALSAATAASTYQPLDSDLTSIAALTTTTYGRSQLAVADAAADTAQLNVFSSTLKGLAPASGGGTTNFLRADGTWAAPAGGGGSSVSASDSAPGSPTANQVWIRTTDMRSFFYYNDGTSSQWAEFGAGVRTNSGVPSTTLALTFTPPPF